MLDLKTIPTDYRLIMVLVLIFAGFSGLSVLMPQGDPAGGIPLQNVSTDSLLLPVAIAGVLLLIYGTLGILGVFLADRVRLPVTPPGSVSCGRVVTRSIWVGAGLGIVFIGLDLWVSQSHAYGQLPHPPFPASLVASVAAATGEEIFFRLFFVSFWVWLVSSVLLKGRGRRTMIWIAAILSSLVFSVAHIPSVAFLLGISNLAAFPPLLLTELMVLNGGLALLAVWLWQRYGFLAAVGVHLGTDLVWHVLWGAVGDWL
jgi:membrane protease YdiL (CAAX protease family)